MIGANTNHLPASSITPGSSWAMSTDGNLSPASDPAERAKGIGGSDIAVILGLSPYKTPLDLFCEKRGIWVDEFASEAAHWGTVMEPVLAREYVRRHGVQIVRREDFIGEAVDFRLYPIRDGSGSTEYEGPAANLLGTLTHPNYPWARGHVDGIGLSVTGDPRHVCEFKTADLRLAGHWGEPESDQVPEPYLVQVQWYMMLSDLEVAEIAALIGGNRFNRYVVHRDQVLIDIMLERASEFWDRVQTGNAPDPVPGERGKESLSRLYPRGSVGKELDATPEVLELALQLHQLREVLRQQEEEKISTENAIKQLLADAVRLNLGPRSYISWANNKEASKTDWEAVARELAGDLELKPEHLAVVVNAHTRITPGSRVFRCQGLDKLLTA